MSSPSPRAYVPNDLLGRLVGLQLFSVEFVMDYIQLRFQGPTQDKPVFNCFVMPHVEVGTHMMTDGQLGYADALRGLIPGVVRQTREQNGTGLRIEFDSGAIVVHPTPDELDTVEIAILQGFEDGRWMCWRPGEDTFEDLA